MGDLGLETGREPFKWDSRGWRGTELDLLPERAFRTLDDQTFAIRAATKLPRHLYCGRLD